MTHVAARQDQAMNALELTLRREEVFDEIFSGDEVKSKQAIEAFLNYPAVVLEMLFEGLIGGGLVSPRRCVAYVLILMPTEIVSGRCRDLLATGSPVVRSWAAAILAVRKDARYAPYIEPLLHSPDLGVQVCAAHALRKLGSPSAQLPMVKLLLEKYRNFYWDKECDSDWGSPRDHSSNPQADDVIDLIELRGVPPWMPR